VPPHLAGLGLDDLPLVGPRIIEHFRAIGIVAPADLVGRSGDDLFEALTRETGSPPHRAMLYVLRMLAHFVATGERHDLRDIAQFMDRK
jgi:hypothetical protein